MKGAECVRTTAPESVSRERNIKSVWLLRTLVLPVTKNLELEVYGVVDLEADDTSELNTLERGLAEQNTKLLDNGLDYGLEQQANWLDRRY